MNIAPKRGLALVGIALLLAVVTWLHFQWLAPIENTRIWTVGGISEIIVWLLLAILLAAAQIWSLPERIRGALTLGLALWLVAATADLLDELLVQPLWMSSWMEDLMRVTGMMIIAFALLGLFRHTSRVMSELEHLSLVDPLTGLANRRSFRQTIERRSEAGFSMILMDLDHFKHVNDRYGHDVGDQVLNQVASALSQCSPGNGEVFRLGGEEFALIARPMSTNDLRNLAESIRRHIEQLKPMPDLALTLSAGAGTLIQGEPHAELMRRIDQALYAAKDKGRNQVEMAEIRPAAVA